MPNFTAADVKKLRDATGAGMMDAKRALEESDGDFDGAVEVLRIKGAAKAAKRSAERTTANGLIAAEGTVMSELACETDFVAKNADFQKLAAEIVADAVPLLPGALSAVEAGFVPGGTRANTEHLSDYIRVEPEVPADIAVLLHDAQTSGGLLFGVPSDVDIEPVLDSLRAKSLPAAVVGKATEGSPGQVTITAANA
jgi:hypothetical protein